MRDNVHVILTVSMIVPWATPYRPDRVWQRVDLFPLCYGTLVDLAIVFAI